MLGEVTEDLALRFGDTIGMLCTFISCDIPTRCSYVARRPSRHIGIHLHPPWSPDMCGRSSLLHLLEATWCPAFLTYIACTCTGGLLNATFGNVVELILSIVALTKGLYEVVRSFMAMQPCHLPCAKQNLTGLPVTGDLFAHWLNLEQSTPGPWCALPLLCRIASMQAWPSANELKCCGRARCLY